MIQNINMTSLDADVAKFVSYTATYLDGTALAQNDILKADASTTYKLRVEFKKNISVSDLSQEDNSLTLTFGVNYVQAPKPVQSNFIRLVKSNALSDSSINFKANSSNSNGKGLYVRTGTTEDDYPIYYYRGAITNNNAKFAGFCWKIVRTTETGGTKLVYNGTPNANGECTNKTGAATQLSSQNGFNPDSSSPTYIGYMYGRVYSYNTKSVSQEYIFGNTFTYENGVYTLSDTRQGLDTRHHYTCFSSSTTCESIKYLFYGSSFSGYKYYTLTNGKGIEDAVNEMNTNTNNSTIKTVVDNWFNNTFKTYFTTNNKDYNDYLEDTIWCNDRSINTIDAFGSGNYINNAWDKNNGKYNLLITYSPLGRVYEGMVTFNCPNKNDSFTVNESDIGNGALTYPVGLLTSDEMVFAGGQGTDYSNYYLYTNQHWWTMSPISFYDGYSANVGLMDNSGYVGSNGAATSRGVRPSISLKPTVRIASGGNGTSTNPYEFVVE